MKKHPILLGALLLLIVGGAFEIWADERPAYDVILIVDKSISMAESKNLPVVKEFLTNSILPNNVIIGDFLIIINFWGQAEVLDSFMVESEADREKAKSIISSIKSTSRETNTDIGNAMDLAKAVVDACGSTERPKIVLMVTDGIQEAPRFSKYYAPDGQFSNAFISQGKTIAQQGWKIHIIEIGGAEDFMDTSAGKREGGAKEVVKADQTLKETSEKMGADRTGVSDKPTVEELEKAVEGLEERIEVVAAPTRLVVPANKLAELNFKLQGLGLKEDEIVAVKEARLTAAALPEQNVLERPVLFTMPAAGEFDFKARLSIPPTLKAGDHQADLQFFFADENAFYPKAFAVTLHVNNFIENYPLLFALLLAGGVLLLALLVFLIIKLIVSRGVKFRLQVEEQPLKRGKDVFKVGFGKWLYLNESYGRLSISPKRSLRSIGRVFGVKKGLEFEPLREDQFPGLKPVKQSIFGHKIKVKTQDGPILHAEFVKI